MYYPQTVFGPNQTTHLYRQITRQLRDIPKLPPGQIREIALFFIDRLARITDFRTHNRHPEARIMDYEVQKIETSFEASLDIDDNHRKTVTSLFIEELLNRFG